MLNRTAVSEDTDLLIGYLSDSYKATVIEASSNTDLIGGWRTPYNWKVNHARLTDDDGHVLIDFENHPLHLWTHSCSFKGKIRGLTLLKIISTRIKIVQMSLCITTLMDIVMC